MGNKYAVFNIHTGPTPEDSVECGIDFNLHDEELTPSKFDELFEKIIKPSMKMLLEQRAIGLFKKR